MAAAGGAGRAGSAVACGCCAPTPRSRTRRCICGPGICSGRTGCTGRSLPPFSRLLLRRPGDLPAAGGAGRQHRRAGRGPAAVAGVHAGGDRAGVGHDRAAVRAAGGVLRGRAVRGAGADAAPGRVRHLRRHGTVPDRAGRLVRGPGRGPGPRGRLDGRGWGRAGAGQRRGVLLSPVRCVRAGAGAAGGVAGRRRPGRRPAGRDGAGGDRRAADRGAPARRRQLPHRGRADHPGPDARLGIRAVGAGRLLVLGRPDLRPGRVRGDHQLGRPARLGADHAAGGAGHRGGGRAAGAGAAAHRGVAEQARRAGRLVRRHRRRLCHRPVHRRRPGRPRPGGHHRGLRGRARLPRSCWAPASPGSSPPAGPTPPASSRSCARSPARPAGRCWSRTPPSPSITCRSAPPSGGGGRPPATSSCPPGPAPAIPPARASSAPAIAAAFARYIARGYFTLVALNFADTTALDHAIRADLRRHHYEPIQVVPYGTEVPPLGQGTYVIYRYEPGR